MYANEDYAHPLRAMGQALETLNIQKFELEPTGDAFLVRGAKLSPALQSVQSTINLDKLRTVWGTVPERKITPAGPSSQAPNALSQIELHYTRQDVERLELEGRARRGTAEEMADPPASLSQLLRCIGAYLTQKLARLQKLSWEGDALCVEYETSLGSRMQETLTASDVYDLWVRMYLQRASRVTQ